MPDPFQHRDPLIIEIARAKLYCASCGYDLTGIQPPACPECGSKLDFGSCDTVTARRPHGFFFRLSQFCLWLANHWWQVLLAALAALILLVSWAAGGGTGH